MNYIGKKLDGFSYAMKGLLEVYSVDTKGIPDLDCLSFRAFSFLMGENVSQWFQTAIPWNAYMENLSRNLGTEERLKVCGANVFFRGKKDYDQWFLVGEVRGLEAIQMLRTSFYQGAKDFYLCKRFNREEMILCDPMGSPYRILDYNILKEKVESSEGFVAWFEQEPSSVLRIALPESVAKRALAWKRERPELLICNQLKGAVEKYSGTGRENYSMQFARMNYQIQVGKAIEYFYQFEMINTDLYRELCGRLNNLPLMREKEDFYRFGEIEEMLWNGLEEGVVT